MPSYREIQTSTADLARKIGEDRREYDSGEARDLSIKVEDLARNVANLAASLADWFGENDQPPAEPTEPALVYVNVPGTFRAQYAGGEVTRLTFTPHGSAAGYFGPSAEVDDYGPGLAGDGSGPFRGRDHVEAVLDVGNVDGPFWKAMRAALEPGTDYDIDGHERPTTTLVPIEWTE